MVRVDTIRYKMARALEFREDCYGYLVRVCLLKFMFDVSPKLMMHLNHERSRH
jgi:hypothetical protein